MGGGRQISPKNLRASLFNDDQSKEPNFGRIISLERTFKVKHTQKLCKKHTVEVSTINKHLVHNFHLKVHKREKFFVSDFEFFTIL